MNKKEIRLNFRKSVLLRDNFKCVFCDESKDLDAHHIMDREFFTNGGYVLENGITLCQKQCHLKAELYHMSNAQKWHKNMHPDDLYKIIKSSFEEAIIADENV